MHAQNTPILPTRGRTETQMSHLKVQTSCTGQSEHRTNRYVTIPGKKLLKACNAEGRLGGGNFQLHIPTYLFNRKTLLCNCRLNASYYFRGLFRRQQQNQSQSIYSCMYHSETFRDCEKHVMKVLTTMDLRDVSKLSSG